MVIDIQKYWGDSEIFYPVELASRIIQSMQQHGHVRLFSKEVRSGRHSGLFKLLDEICEVWQWSPEKITIMTPNVFEKHHRYTIERMCHWHCNLEPLPRVEPPAWDGSKVYGMFLGRATAERIRGVVRHQNFEYRDLGLTSFHHDLQEHIDTAELLEYLCETNDTFDNILKIRPYSDIGDLYLPPIVGPKTTDWNRVYQQIATEIIFETSTAEDCITWTEKCTRPILYARPGLLIAGRHTCKNVKNFEFQRAGYEPIRSKENAKLIDKVCFLVSDLKFFENVFGTDYDNDAGVHRVDHVFDILHTLIRTGQADKILSRCQKDLDHNRNLLKELHPLTRQLTMLAQKYYDKSTWPQA